MTPLQLATRFCSKTTQRGACALLTVLVLASVPALTRGAVIDANPSNYRSLLASLAPGDTLNLASGTYPQGLPLDAMAGTASQPIIIRGPDDQSAVFTARSCCNTVQLDGTSYVQVLNLTLDGGGLDGPFGVDSRGNSHHITLENLKIIRHNGSQQTDGISTKGPAWNWVIRRNTIIGAGTGLYLGSSDGTAPFVAGIIEYNVVLDTIGYNMEIKHQVSRPTGTGLPTGDSRTIIRHNVFAKRSSTVGSDGARPNVLVGHFPLSGTGSNDLYEIYGNFFYENPTEGLFQGEGNIALHDNLFVNDSGDAVNIQPHNDKPRTVTVYHNTVVATGVGLRISGGDPGYVQKLIANASFAATPISGPNQQSNITGSYSSASAALNTPFAPIGSLDLFPKAGQLSGSTLDLSAFAGFTDGTKDFNGNARTGVHRGAYEGEGTNSGWRLALAVKPTVGGATPPPAVSLTADPKQVPLQGSSTLQWSAADATSCTASGGWSGSRALSGTETVGPLASDTTFTLTCTGAEGSDSGSVSVSVVSSTPPPTVTLSASPGSISAGETSTLSWQAAGATTCSASGDWSGGKATTGTETVGPLQAAANYALNCQGDGGNASASTQVTVAAATPPSTTPPSTTPPPTSPSTNGTSSSGGAGALDKVTLSVLPLLALLGIRRAQVRARRSPAD